MKREWATHLFTAVLGANIAMHAIFAMEDIHHKWLPINLIAMLIYIALLIALLIVLALENNTESNTKSKENNNKE